MIMTIVFSVFMALSQVAVAGDVDSLFINLIRDEGHRVIMAIGFGGILGCFFLSDTAVAIASQANATRFPDRHKAQRGALARRGKAIDCPITRF